MRLLNRCFLRTGLFALIALCSSSLSTLADDHRSRIIKTETIQPRIESVTWYSQQLEQEKRFSVVLPKGYSPPEPIHGETTRKNWPVLYLLHGRGRHERSLIDDAEARSSLLQAEFVIILPDGDDGWYIDSPIRKRDRYESYLTELIDLADRHYELSPEPKDRALCGWSMGGYGAMHYMVEHPDDFSAIVTLIGLLDFPREGLPPEQSYVVPLQRFGEDRQDWLKWNSLFKADRLKQKSILLLTADEAFDRTMNENFSQKLQELQIPHQYKVLKGGHSFSVVRSGLTHMIQFGNDHFSSSPTKDTNVPSE
ncbi:Carbohydrate acetyl esterase/feruloyl esterase precursor [Polystyrenella longa]|uniref:Carbohydrate acetyl esterase/feruloyl esterase n=2 Tax=Polystyrenella longa TaxID=2528007 RepID=A0A518CIA0_9PLAN|nr:Carbohydrate acetyl esterase/feruloyl esterase precursor [Polystyrenella longa]